MIAGYRGERLHRPTKLEKVLNNAKDEIITYCVDNPTDYSPSWLAQEIKEFWWEDFDDAGIDPTIAAIEKLVRNWDKEIRGEIAESYEPTALEEANRDIMEETIKSL